MDRHYVLDGQYLCSRYFEGSKNSKQHLTWGEVDMQKLGQYMLFLCSAVKQVFENEPRLLYVDSPCYILGINCWLAFVYYEESIPYYHID